MKPFFMSYSPRCRVKVYDLATGEFKRNISDDVTSLSTNKAYGRAAGMWQMMLPYKQVASWKYGHKGTLKYYHEILVPDDLLTIELDAGDGNGFKPVMLALVDRVSVVREGDVHPVRQVKISGQDAGKLLVKHEIGWDISTAQEQGVQQNLGQMAFVDQKDESKVALDAVIESYMSRVVLQTGKSADLFERLALLFLKQLDNRVVKKMDFKTDTDDTWMMQDTSMMFIRDTSVWDAMMRLSHRPYNMLHADTSPIDVGQFVVTLEKNPITKEGKTDRKQAGIDLHLIDDTEIISDDVGASDAERINLLCYWPALYKFSVSTWIDIVMANSNLTKKNLGSIGLHGYCAKIIDDFFVPPNVTDSRSDSAANQIKAWGPSEERADLFWAWYKNSHTYESGVFNVHLRPDIRAGNCLVVQQGNTDTFKEYLVEQVAHHYSVNQQRPQFITNLQVTRGQEAAQLKRQLLTSKGILV